MGQQKVAERRSVLTILFYIIPILISCIVGPIDAESAEVTLAWNANTNDNIAGYRLYYRSCSAQEPCDSIGDIQNTTTINIPVNALADPAQPTYTLTNLTDYGRYLFACTAYNSRGAESDLSNEVVFDCASQTSANPPDTGTEQLVVIDNNSSNVQISGTWSTSGGKNPYGDQSFYSSASNAAYTYSAAAAGSYDIYMWWTTWWNRCTDVPVEIHDGAKLIDTVIINQKENDGIWNRLGSYHFDQIPRVKIISQGGCSTCADAVWFDPIKRAELSRIVIESPVSIAEMAEVQLQCLAYYTDGSSRSVDADYWVVSCPEYADISDAGIISCKTVASDQQCRIWAEYQEGGVMKEAVREITIADQTSDRSVVIVDNRSSMTSSVGRWKVSAGSGPYGKDSVYSSTPDNRFTFNANITGNYRVSVRWTTYKTRCRKVPIEIYNGDRLMSRIIVNQQVDGGQWNILGNYKFDGNAGVSIKVPDRCSTCADAVRFD